MLLKLNKYSYLIFAICFFTIAAIIENGLLKKHPENHLISDFREEVLIQESILNRQINEISAVISDNDFIKTREVYIQFFDQLCRRHAIRYFRKTNKIREKNGYRFVGPRSRLAAFLQFFRR